MGPSDARGGKRARGERPGTAQPPVGAGRGGRGEGGPWRTGEVTARTCVPRGGGGWGLWHLGSLELGFLTSDHQRKAGWCGFGGWR